MSQHSDTFRIPAPGPAVYTPEGPGAEQPLGFAAVRSLKRELLEELRNGAEAGGPVRPEDLLPRWPTDARKDPDVASLLFEDFCRRQRQGEPASVSDYEERFPEHKDSLAGLVREHAVLRSLGGTSTSGTRLRLPDVGEELFGFRLRHELGRGAFARVFLAEQGGLADRPVVLKISAIDGNEPQTLAQLQHTHIVPIYSVHEDPAAGLRAVCMPYFGGASLSRVLEAVWAETQRPTRGAQLLRALRAVQAPAGSAESGRTQDPGPRTQQSLPSSTESVPSTPHSCPLAALDYCRAAVWVVARLAEALQHAHQRGVLHRDIKPSNILLSADGQPMLLDFNLAQDTRANAAQVTLGGTVAYMAPEHLRALASRDLARARQVDQRADVYALGMVLYEMLAGRSPFDQSASYTPLPVLIEAMALERARTTPSLRRQRGDVPWGLESIVRRSLAPDPARRYQHAGELADDLRRFLDDQPLKHAPELSRAERFRKWARRHPRLTSSASVATVAALLLVLTGATLAGAWQHLTHTRAQLAVEQARDRQRRYEAGTVQALCLVNTTSAMPDHAARGRQVCEETLDLYHVLDRDDWQQEPDWQRLTAEDRQRLAEDTRELLMLLAWSRVQAGLGAPDTLRGALALLDRAEAIEGLQPSPALALDRAAYLAQLGDSEGARGAKDAAERLEPVSARDHYLLATTFSRNKDYARAIQELDQATTLNPRHYWSWMQKGLCHQELGDHDLGAADFGVCIGLWPEFAWGYFNRGYSLMKSGQLAEAVADYSAAIRDDPDFRLAYLNRATSRYALKQYEPALADLTKVAELGQDDASLHAVRGETLEALGRSPEADAAFRIAFERAEPEGEDVLTTVRLQYGFAVQQRLPKQAREAFEEVLRKKPGHPQAEYGLAMLLMENKAGKEALPYFDRAIQANPDFAEARRYRGILLARLGKFEAASQDINWCIERQPRSGEPWYAAACVSALLAKQWAAVKDDAVAKAQADAAVNQALDFLQRALALGCGRDRAGTDPDLEGMRPDPRFRQLLQQE